MSLKTFLTRSSETYLFSLVQIALTDLMTSLHIIPDYIIGYSIGELVCAYADGCLTLEETLTAAYYCAVYLATKFENSSDTVTVVIGKVYIDLHSLLMPRRIVTKMHHIVGEGPCR